MAASHLSNCAELGACAWLLAFPHHGGSVAGLQMRDLRLCIHCCLLQMLQIKTTYTGLAVFQKQLTLWFAFKKIEVYRRQESMNSQIEQDRAQHTQKQENSVHRRRRKVQDL